MSDQSVRLTDSQINADIMRPLLHTSHRFYVTIGVLALIVAWGAFAWGYQALTGMGVAGINRPVGWGIYIATFVFWIGLSHSGTLISAILRITQAEWRRPITRGAEAMTVFTVIVAAMFPIIHLGRAWNVFWFLPIPDGRGLWPNFRSPLLWDFMAITTYLTGSLIYLYLPMIPDMALLRDKATGWRRRLYTILSLGWRGTQSEWRNLRRALGIMCVLIIPVAVSVHTIVSWDFAMTLVPMWHSTIFAPYFVAGAIYSGLALVITIMLLLRWVLRLEDYLQPSHFNNLGKMLFAMSLIWFYFWFADVLTIWYGQMPAEAAVLEQIVAGPYMPIFLIMLMGNFVVPFFTLMHRRVRTSSLALFVVSILVNVGMFAERLLIVIPPLAHGHLPFTWGEYFPSWVELSIIAASFAGFTLLYLLFTKMFPVIAIWEVKEGELIKSTREVAGVAVPTIARVEE